VQVEDLVCQLWMLRGTPDDFLGIRIDCSHDPYETPGCSNHDHRIDARQDLDQSETRKPISDIDHLFRVGWGGAKEVKTERLHHEGQSSHTEDDHDTAQPAPEAGSPSTPVSAKVSCAKARRYTHWMRDSIGVVHHICSRTWSTCRSIRELCIVSSDYHVDEECRKLTAATPAIIAPPPPPNAAGFIGYPPLYFMSWSISSFWYAIVRW
jgi:hypothetical protein